MSPLAGTLVAGKRRTHIYKSTNAPSVQNYIMYFSRPLKLPFPLSSLDMTHETCSARAGILFFCIPPQCSQMDKNAVLRLHAPLLRETDFQIDWSELLCRVIKFLYKSISLACAESAVVKSGCCWENVVVNWRGDVWVKLHARWLTLEISTPDAPVVFCTPCNNNNCFSGLPAVSQALSNIGGVKWSASILIRFLPMS